MRGKRWKRVGNQLAAFFLIHPICFFAEVSIQSWVLSVFRHVHRKESFQPTQNATHFTTIVFTTSKTINNCYNSFIHSHLPRAPLYSQNRPNLQYFSPRVPTCVGLIVRRYLDTIADKPPSKIMAF
eukprot:scaffold2256_cov166-Amphora_coffeaeformis.AAC.14